MAALFACTKCNGRHPFDDLSKDQQLCKDCRGASVKCTFCRTEFQQESKRTSPVICKKCDQNVKLYGKPTACEFCNIIAAFIGSKCQRCTNSEKKYGAPLTCDQCKQRCAFDRKDESRKKVMVDGKLLCWLCTLSYKRALAKAKQNDSSRSATKNSIHHSRSSSSSHSHKHSHSHSNSHKSNEHTGKKPRLDVSKNSNGAVPNSESVIADANSTDHMVALTQLREQIASLQKQLNQKDQQLLGKDKQISEFKAKMFSSDKEMRTKIVSLQKANSDQVQELQVKLRGLQKQVATLTKQNKKGNSNTDSPAST